MFDQQKDTWSAERAQLRDLLDDAAYDAARRTTINAHYTDPAYVREIWSALSDLGFDGGRVLEPGAGSGTFIGLAPDSAQMIGVELDPTTAAIASGLYPQAQIRAESFADTALPDNWFDAAVGNVPFGDITLHDTTHNRGRHSLHNHFIIKSLALTRPGGTVAVLTSRYTLDAQNPAARREINRSADLVAAVRLPTGAHRRAAGTDAVTDLLILRKRQVGEPLRSQLWETVTARQVDGEAVKINSYFDTHPENILGTLGVGHGMYGSTTLNVTSPDLSAVPAQLHAVLASEVAAAREAGLTMSQATAAVEAAREEFVPTDTALWDGTILQQPDGTFATTTAGLRTPLSVPKNAAQEMRALLKLRDTTVRLLDREAATIGDSDELTGLREDLRGQYETYAAAYGPINRFTLHRTGHLDKETGDDIMSRHIPAAVRAFRRDPFGPAVLALEVFDEESQAAAHAAILSQRVVAQRPLIDGADTATDAAAISLDRLGRIDLDTVAHLLGTDPEAARTQLGRIVYDDPATGQLVHAPEYLSGNVRGKLDAARAAAETDPDRYQANVAALQDVLPQPLTMDQIQARLGAVWIGPADVQQFLQETLRDRSIKVENPLPGMWEVRGNRRSILATEEWGTRRRPATDIAQAALEQATLIVKDKVDRGEKTAEVTNALETEAVQEKVEKLHERFAEWVWEDPQRAARLADEYNRRFNSIVLRDYAAEGEHLTLPGMAESFQPRPHQRAAVARMIAEPAVGLFHQVGAGKTAEMVIGAMELRRMGLVSKPAVVVPNHMLEQFSREWLQLYPQARILAASSSDLSGEKRRLFVARAAANDWDAVIMTRTAFQRLPLQPDFTHEYIEREVAATRKVLEDATGEDRMSVKRIEKRLAALEQKQKDLTDLPRDAGISFESTGFDYVIVDEMHEYKNLATDSRISGASIGGSDMATDLHMKMEYLRSRHGNRVGTVATATPIANSVTEAYVMQRYLRPDLLDQAGIGVFDAWAATFGQTETAMEMAVTGGENFKMKTRFSKFRNVPEMLKMWHVFADVKTAEDLKLPVPELEKGPDGKRLPMTHVIQPGPGLIDYLQEISDRADAVGEHRVEPEVDNMLKISTDGRKAALDMRMVDREAEPGRVKLDAVAEEVLRIWHETKDQQFTDPVTGELSPVTGGLQLIFSDLGTPSDKWNAYDEIRDKLVAGGMRAQQVRFMHEARNDAEKGRLFAAARAGYVSVLIGSTQKMGVGTNVQARAVALHHVDCPWRPADVEQRDGRIIRQGNQNAEVGVHRYVVERSFDGFMWGTVERKAKFIAQIMRGRLDVREIEDVGDASLSLGVTKALASGNPLLLEHAQLTDQVAKLQRLSRAHSRSQSNLSAMRHAASLQIPELHRSITALETAQERIVDTSGDRFRMTVNGHFHTKRAEAGEEFTRWAALKGLAYMMPRTGGQDLGTVAEVGGFTVTARATTMLGKAQVAFVLQDLPGVETVIEGRSAATTGIGMITRLENLPTRLPRVLHDTRAALATAEATISDAEQRLGRPFGRAAELDEATGKLAVVNEQLTAQMNANKQQGTAETTGAVTPAASTHDEPGRRTLVRRRPADPNTGPVTGPAPAFGPGLDRG